MTKKKQSVMAKKRCNLKPYVSIQYCYQDGSGSFVFNPECKCKDCKDLKRSFMIIAEKLRRGITVEEAVKDEQCYFHRKDLDYCIDCVKQVIQIKLDKGELKYADKSRKVKEELKI